MEQRHRFVSLAESGHFTIRELCEQFGISRKSGYKWIARYRATGSKGLEDRRRAPLQVPGRTDAEIERLIVAERRRRPTWGPKKLREVLMVRHGVERPPATSTIGAILKRNGLVEARRRRPGVFRVDRGTLTRAERPLHQHSLDPNGDRLGIGVVFKIDGGHLGFSFELVQTELAVFSVNVPLRLIHQPLQDHSASWVSVGRIATDTRSRSRQR